MTKNNSTESTVREIRRKTRKKYSAEEKIMNDNRPKPFSKYTAVELWCDEHISAQMLACHLNPDIDPASRNHTFIEL